MLGDALIHTFVASADHGNPSVAGKPAGAFLVKQSSPRRKQNPGEVPLPGRFHYPFQCGKNRFRLQHHPRPAAEGSVIHRPMFVGGVVAKIVDPNGRVSRLQGAMQDAMRQHAGKKVGEDGENFKRDHGRNSVLNVFSGIYPRNLLLPSPSA